jgi:hypothetical protein
LGEVIGHGDVARFLRPITNLQAIRLRKYSEGSVAGKQLED